ncbi:MAG: hypothetical protein R3218_10105 [Christiangramia sp.]|nr:hypothetical protein [Christiangramia sp.]
MKKIISTLCLLAVVSLASAQEINNYKYILIPESYDFLKEVNQYQLNALTKFLFEEEGFNTVMMGEDKPADLKANSCLALKTKLQNNSGLFVTKLVIELEDCYGKIVFTSKEGRSREKEFKRGYQEALRDAFTSIEELDYKYNAAEVAKTTEKDTKENTSVKVGIAVTPEQADVDPSEVSENTPKQASGDQKVEGTATYSLSGENYMLKTINQGYELYQIGSSEPIAILIKSESGDSFIYNSLTNQGIAYFDSARNLIVEYFSRQENKKISLKYELNN